MRRRLERLEARAAAVSPADLGPAVPDPETCERVYRRMVPVPELAIEDQELDARVVALAGRVNGQLAGLDAQALSQRYRQRVMLGS